MISRIWWWWWRRRRWCARATVAARNFGSIIERSGDRKIPALFRAREPEWGGPTSYWPPRQGRGGRTTYTLGRYLSRLQLLTSYRYRGHSPILYSPSFVSTILPLPPPSLSRFLSPFQPLYLIASNERTGAGGRAARISVEFRLMNYMRIRCKFYRRARANIYSCRWREIVVTRAGVAVSAAAARERDGAAVNSRRFFDLDRPIAARRRDLAPKREINMVCKWSGARGRGGGRGARKRGYRFGKTTIAGGAGGRIRKEFQLRARRFFDREKLVCRWWREIENEEFSWSDI